MTPNHQPSVFPFVMYVLATSMIFAAFALVLVLQITLRHDILVNRMNGLVTQTYNRADACIISVSPTTRTPAYVQSCYSKAEAVTGIKVQRFGDDQ